MSARAFLPALVAAAAVLGVVSFLIGRSFGGDDAAAAFSFNQSAYESPASAAALSTGGFSGFGEVAGADGLTVSSGRIVSVEGNGATIETASGVRQSVRLDGNAPLRRIEAASAADLRPGASVIVRLAPDGSVAALLLLAVP